MENMEEFTEKERALIADPYWREQLRQDWETTIYKGALQNIPTPYSLAEQMTY